MRRKFDFWQSTVASFLPQRNRRGGRRREVTPKSRSLHGRFEVLEYRCMLSVTGDYNGSGLVEVTDYTVWKTSFGSTVSAGTGADGNGDGVIDAADYTVYRDNLGSSTPAVPFVNISIDGLSEAIEESPGAIVFRNSDFSKQSLAMNQPESGLPLYVPDYSAPSSIFDPNAAVDFTSAIAAIDPSMIGTHQVRFTYDSLQLELWTTQNWPGLEAAGPGLFRIPSGFNLAPNTATLSFLIEGLENSESFSTDFIQVEAIPTGGGTTLQDRGYYTVVETGMGVDGNRDTAIDFDNSHDRQLLFWFNNDQEGFHDTDTAVEAEQPNITTPDNSDNLIGQRRDLEDLAPLRVNVAPLLVQNAFDTAGMGTPDPGQLQVTYRLNLVNPAGATLRLFYSNNEQADVTRHVSDDSTANVQATDTFFRAAAAPSFATQLQLEQIGEGLNSFLFEAIGAAYGTGFTATPTLEFETIVEYADGSTTTKTQAVELDLRDIKQLYTRWDIDYGVNGGVPGTDLRLDTSFQHFVTPTETTHSSQITMVPFHSGDDHVVFVHGWNNSDVVGNDDKAAAAETMFKRLYWQGFRGEFAAFNWPTFYPEGPFGDTYNPSEFQAYRSANALKEILADYRGEAPNLQPVQLLAHSMGNIVAGEALRIWTYELPFNDDPLVTNYVAMQAAVSAGAYGSNGTDSLFPGRPEPDLYRFWSHGQQDGLTNPSLGVSYYFQGAGFGAEQRINMYNQADFALDLWDANNVAKEAVDEFFPPVENPYYPSTIWPFGYLWQSGPDRDLNANDDTFERYNANETLNATLTLTNPQGRPGVNAYEIMAFFAQSADTAVGTKSVAQFDVNINIQTFGLLGGNNIRANHSYQFNHDAAEAWEFYERLKTELQFGATYGAAALVATFGTSLESPSLDGKSYESPRLDSESHDRLARFLQPIAVSSQKERAFIKDPVVYEPTLRPPLSRLEILDAYYEEYQESDRRWAVERPLSEAPEPPEIVWESLSLGQGRLPFIPILS
jgi:hypothetical protein